MENIDKIRIAYKKLKSTIFFDKTQLPLRDEIVRYEVEVEDNNRNNIDRKLESLEKALFDGTEWEETERKILDSIDVLVYPKKLKEIKEDTAIFNSNNIEIEMEQLQYFIDLSVEGHILSVLWILEFGSMLDKNAGESDCINGGMYPHSYGNRLRKHLINEETSTYTYAPGLFQPYFEQYESWRDNAIDRAKERLNSNQDALILTLDFKSFYYSVDIQKSMFENIKTSLGMSEPWQLRLISLIYKIIERYATSLRKIHKDDEDTLSVKNRNILPIGFLPSNILANMVLTPFDNAVIKWWNPTYYGRYVDDVIIVDKVETNSEIYRLAHEENCERRLSSENIIDFFLCGQEIGKKQDDDKKDNDRRQIMEPEEKENEPGKTVIAYHILGSIIGCGESDIRVQNGKVKLFYFQSGATEALLTCFRSKIKENVSEFRLLPNMDNVFQYNDYSDLFHIANIVLQPCIQPVVEFQ